MNKCLHLSIFLSLALAVEAQNSIVATTASGQTNVAAHMVMVNFVASDASTATAAAKDAALGNVEGQVLTRTVSPLIRLPGPLGAAGAEAAVRGVAKVFHRDKPIKGFNIAFIQGLSGATVLGRGIVTFVIPSQMIEEGRPILVRVRTSAKDSARIVRSVRASMKSKNSQINPMASDNKVLGVDEDIVPCRQEARGGDVVLSSISTLEVGEYAVIIVPPTAEALSPVAKTWVWDFGIH